MPPARAWPCARSQGHAMQPSLTQWLPPGCIRVNWAARAAEGGGLQAESRLALPRPLLHCLLLRRKVRAACVERRVRSVLEFVGAAARRVRRKPRTALLPHVRPWHVNRSQPQWVACGAVNRLMLCHHSSTSHTAPAAAVQQEWAVGMHVHHCSSTPPRSRAPPTAASARGSCAYAVLLQTCAVICLTQLEHQLPCPAGARVGTHAWQRTQQNACRVACFARRVRVRESARG